MQCSIQRSIRAQPFTSAKSLCRVPAARSFRLQNVQRQTVTVRAAEAAFDVSEYADDVDLSVSATSSAASLESSENARLRIRLRGYDHHLLREAVEQIQAIADSTGALFKGPIMLPTRKKVYCVLRSPHVNKDAREHFEVRTHHRLVDLKNLSAETVEAMMQWVPPSGLEVEASIV